MYQVLQVCFGVLLIGIIGVVGIYWVEVVFLFGIFDVDNVF